jgi:hypothetical protein
MPQVSISGHRVNVGLSCNPRGGSSGTTLAFSAKASQQIKTSKLAPGELSTHTLPDLGKIHFNICSRRSRLRNLEREELCSVASPFLKKNDKAPSLPV